MADEVFIVSVKHTRRFHRYVTLWRPDCRGYCWPLPWAGQYSTEQVDREPDYLNNGEHTLAVRAEVIRALAEDPRPGDVDGDTGPVVANTRKNWNAIIAGAIAPPQRKPKPEVRRAA